VTNLLFGIDFCVHYTLFIDFPLRKFILNANGNQGSVELSFVQECKNTEVQFGNSVGRSKTQYPVDSSVYTKCNVHVDIYYNVPIFVSTVILKISNNNNNNNNNNNYYY
jgi:hypothetical protein